MQFRPLHGVIPFTFTLVCCLMPALLLFFLGFEKNRNWNENSIEINCIVSKHEVYGTNNGEYGSYKSYIITNYTVDGEIYTSEFYINKKDDERNAYKNLEKNYPIGKEITCYYDPENIEDVRLNLKPTRVFMAFFCIFVILGIILCLFSIWLIKK